MKVGHIYTVFLIFIGSKSFSQQVVDLAASAEILKIPNEITFQNDNAIITNKKEMNINKQQPYGKLYQYGVADAFVGGLYTGTLALKELQLKGDFGLGAADMLDGELTMLDGKIYQTKATGETVEPDSNFKTSILFTTFFKADMTINVDSKVGEKELWARIDRELKNRNTIYAIKITGKFDRIRTRAFPPVEHKPFPPITSILDRQKIFEFEKTEGTLVGYHLPEYLNGINTKGFHFHFLSNDKTEGGHVLNFTAQKLTIAIAELKSFELAIPEDKDFQDFKFETKDNEALKRVEQGQ